VCVQIVKSKALAADTEQELQMGVLRVNLAGNLGGYHTYLKCILIIVNVVAHTEEERRLRVSENRVTMRIFGPKRDDVTGECRRLHNEDFTIYTAHQILFG